MQTAVRDWLEMLEHTGKVVVAELSHLTLTSAMPRPHLSEPDFRFLVRLYAATIEVPFDGGNGCGIVADPIFINDNGDLIQPADPDVVAAVKDFAEDRLANLGWDWTDTEGGCGTVYIDVVNGTYQVEAYKRRVVMEAHLMSGSLALVAQGSART